LHLPARLRRPRTRQAITAYALIAPAMLAAVAFLYIPMILSAYWSLTRYNGLTSPEWVGLDNYTSLFGDERFMKALRNTVLFVVMGMTIGPALGLGAALLLNQKIRARGFFRTAFFLPVTASLVVVATVWKMLLNDQGIVNELLGVVGIGGHSWLSDPDTALPTVALVSIWQGLGFETVVFLAALQSIPQHLYDAARVDGANAWMQFRHVTLPGLRPTLLFIFVIGIIGSFQVFDQVFVMTQGGPAGSTETVVYYLVERFQSLELGKASAVAYILLAILGTLSFLQFRLFEERDR
jgi:multiple sugar transport system permease protein